MDSPRSLTALGKKTVPHPLGFSPEASVAFTRRQQLNQSCVPLAVLEPPAVEPALRWPPRAPGVTLNPSRLFVLQHFIRARGAVGDAEKTSRTEVYKQTIF